MGISGTTERECGAALGAGYRLRCHTNEPTVGFACGRTLWPVGSTKDATRHFTEISRGRTASQYWKQRQPNGTIHTSVQRTNADVRLAWLYFSGFLPKIFFLFSRRCHFEFFSGESAFHAMMSGFGWAKHPMLNRMHEVKEEKPITILYGSRSWIDKSSWDLMKNARSSSYVNVQVPQNGVQTNCGWTEN